MSIRPGTASMPNPSVTPVDRWRAVAQRVLMHPWARPVVFGLMCGPLAWLIWAVFMDQLGANPAEALIRSLGDWTLRSLVLVMCITPLRVGLGLPALARWRRMLGLFVFFYASLHLTAYAWFDMGFYWSEMVADVVVARPLGLLATIGGAAAFVVSLPFSALGGNVPQAADALVVGPAKATFVRCLGCKTSTRYQSPAK